MIVLGLGSNLGDRAANLWQGLACLGASGVAVRRLAPVYESPALVPEGAPEEWNIPYLNSAAIIETELEPLPLLTVLKRVEAEVGRRASRRWAPRPLDLDILAWDDQVLASELLNVPHQGLPVRRFALLPLADVAPQWRHPALGRTAAEMLQDLPDDGTRRYV